MSRFFLRVTGVFHEAKRRRVLVSVMAYLAIAITIIELSDAVFSALLLPEWAPRLVTVLLILGFPVVLALAWIFDVTPKGVRRTEVEHETEQAASFTEKGSARPASGHVAGLGTAPPLPRARNRLARVRRVLRGGADSALARGLAKPAADAGVEPEEAESGAPPDPERLRRAALGHVRHELKTPINAILGYSEMLLDDLTGTDRAEMGEDLKRIGAAGHQLLALVDGILGPAHLTPGEGGLDLERFGEKIRTDLRDPIGAVVGYAELLIETCEESGRSELVADLERIRTAAFQLLELSSDIVQVATSREGDAAARRLGEASALAEEVLSKAGSLRSSTATDATGSLLVVDDNALNRDLLSRQLAGAGYVVQTAENGPVAIRLMEERDFDLILLDVIMPEMDGLEVLGRVKRAERTADTPVIMLSSLDDMASAIKCIELGADDFLSKPFHPTLLHARIGAAIEMRQLRESARSELAERTEMEEMISRLLRSAFPGPIGERVRAGETEILETYPEASVLWCDVESATRFRNPTTVAARLQEVLTAIERVADAHELESVASLRGGVVLAGGVPVPCDDHAERIAEAALDLRAALAGAEDGDGPIRLGMDCGPVTSAVLGGETLSYRMWGEPVDLARALGGQAGRGAIAVSPMAHERLRDRYRFGSGRVQEIPDRGQMRTYLLEGPG